MENLKKVKENLYELKLENLTVEILYAKTYKKLEESLLNILKIKMKEG